MPGPPINCNEVLSILKKYLSITIRPGLIEYILVGDREYDLVNYQEIQKLMRKPDFEAIVKKLSSSAIFIAAGDFRVSLLDSYRWRAILLFIDTQRRLWMIDPSSETISYVRSHFRIERVSPL